MTEPSTPAEVMLAATRSSLRSGRMGPAQVIRHQLEALTAAGYRLRPVLGDGGAEILRDTAKRAFRTGRFRPADVIAAQLAALAAAGHTFQLGPGGRASPCEEFVWGPNSFESCAECGLSFWRHGERGEQDSRPPQHSES